MKEREGEVDLPVLAVGRVGDAVPVLIESIECRVVIGVESTDDARDGVLAMRDGTELAQETRLGELRASLHPRIVLDNSLHSLGLRARSLEVLASEEGLEFCGRESIQNFRKLGGVAVLEKALCDSAIVIEEGVAIEPFLLPARILHLELQAVVASPDC